MKYRPLIATVVSFVPLIGSCGGGTQTTPSGPTAVATPTPAPTPTPTPVGNPAARATAALIGYTRNEGTGQGRFPIPPMPAYFQQADWIDIDCTPRDADNRPTNNHPPFAEWYYSSGGAGVLVQDYDYVVEEDDRYTPQLQLRYLARTGYIDMYCKIPGTNITSNVVRIGVFGGIK